MALKAAKNYDANNCIEQEQQDPITWQHVKAINESINGSINQYENGDLRDMALILVAYRTMFRAAELREIRVEHVNFEDMTVKIFKTKGKCETQIKPICESTAIAISRWMGAAGINEGPLFRSFYRGKRSVRPTAMGADVVSDVFKEKMALAGFDNKNISAHSTRIGAAQDLYTNGAHTGEIMKSGGWDSPAMVLRYCRNVSAHTGGMGDMLRAQSL
jgi:integrase